ncbi:hypothetical protein M9978_08155 [Sphingomonas sp. MG17]|uniref:Uncharacterized protein n=1 Tax=Sphingomonas tagetis TaxID=2949092 RepID=A0A9X2HPX5_9SPHN|nr:hypothetical protein [Sphingomonas tagetis]MCP3730400.1 hypothetical protein [Sphingomonas tagetis]
MPTPKDEERIAAFRAFVNWLDKDAVAAELLDMDRRSVKRLRTVKPAPPPLLEKCARWADQHGKDRLAARLFDAARPAQEPAPEVNHA